MENKEVEESKETTEKCVGGHTLDNLTTAHKDIMDNFENCTLCGCISEGDDNCFKKDESSNTIKTEEFNDKLAEQIANETTGDEMDISLLGSNIPRLIELLTPCSMNDVPEASQEDIIEGLKCIRKLNELVTKYDTDPMSENKRE